VGTGGGGPPGAVGVTVALGPRVGVSVGVGEGPAVAVEVGVGDGPAVEVKVGVGAGPAAQIALEMLLVSIVTAPLRASARPETITRVVSVMLVRARMFPENRVSVPRVAELPICQNTLQLDPMLVMRTLELLAVVSVLPIWKTKTAAGLP
jgi:hypothetical protein